MIFRSRQRPVSRITAASTQSARNPRDVLALRRALNTVFLRHEALRSVFVTVDGEPQVRLLPVTTELPLIEHDLRGREDASVELARLGKEEARAPFDLTQGPLIRGRLVQLGEEDHVLLLTQHHIVSDGWSIGVLSRELSTLYRAFQQGQGNPLPPLAIQYPDYAAWQRAWLSGERLERQIGTGGKRWRARRCCWSCRRIVHGRRSGTLAVRMCRWCWMGS